jgi:GTP-binding protein Era
MTTQSPDKTYSGFIAIIGRPNVGKSTLINKVLGKKLSITSSKAQTTRHNILCVKTEDNAQAVFVDTPGFNQLKKTSLHRYLNRTTSAVIHEVDLILFMVDSKYWSEEDTHVLSLIKQATCPVILVLNKVDLLASKTLILPKMDELNLLHSFASIVPISAKNNYQTDMLLSFIYKLLPENEFLFDRDEVSTRDDRFFVSEIIREKLMRYLGDELPYTTTVELELFEEKKNIMHIGAIIWVERESQKAIVIGKKGQLLKTISTQARMDIQRLLESKVYIRLWVKVKEGWSDDSKKLESLGYQG